MPAKSPLPAHADSQRLAAIGERIHLHRKRARISASAAAEAAGMSRVTLYRIERGEPSVTMGAYMGAISALGLELKLDHPGAAVQPVPPATSARTGRAPSVDGLPDTIRLADYPQLQRLAWHMQGATELTRQEALNLYERNWRHIDHERVEPHEQELMRLLANSVGKGRLLV